MKTLVKTYQVYKFGELSDSAKEKAIQDHVADGFFDHESVICDAKEIAKLMGIDVENVYFSGFWNQGDGACFTGRYWYNKGSVAAVTERAPQDEELHRIVKTLANIQKRNFYQLYAGVKHRGRYHHSRCTIIDVERDSWTNECSENDSDDLAECLRDFMNWIYKQLQAEYEYTTGEEYFADLAETNEWVFLENGEIFN